MTDHTNVPAVNALAIIREQEAEITRLTSERDELRELLAEAYADAVSTAYADAVAYAAYATKLKG